MSVEDDLIVACPTEGRPTYVVAAEPFEALQAELARVREVTETMRKFNRSVIDAEVAATARAEAAEAERDDWEQMHAMRVRELAAAEARCVRVAEEKVAEIVAALRECTHRSWHDAADLIEREFGSVAGDAKPTETTRDLRTPVGDGLCVKPLGHTPAGDVNEKEGRTCEECGPLGEWNACPHDLGDANEKERP